MRTSDRRPNERRVDPGGWIADTPAIPRLAEPASARKIRNRMPSTRQLVLIPAPDDEGGAATLGTRRDVVRSLARFNTRPDGSPDGSSIVHGPGFRGELPMCEDGDDVSQILVTIVEEEIAWPVLSRLCRGLDWRMMDPDSGRTFGGGVSH